MFRMVHLRISLHVCSVYRGIKSVAKWELSECAGGVLQGMGKEVGDCRMDCVCVYVGELCDGVL